ncbi:MAG: excinuclease subunit, partial [Pseudonocardiales bacterium]|nr:excinuclease subunit [Pseudonocardiales bacterium]
VCKGARYNRDTLDIAFKGKNIAQVLDMPCEEALEFFANQPPIARHMQTIVDVGLGYVRLGQPAPTLSGGEAQRVKLASELQKRSTGRTIYVLDEPTTGLHFEDVSKLLAVLQSLVDKGNSVMVIEHNLDVIKTADWVIDMGPEGGSGGGTVVAQGTPEDVALVDGSYTGQFLSDILAEQLAALPAAGARSPGKRTAAKAATRQATAKAATKEAAARQPATKRAAAKAGEPARTVRQPVAAKTATPRTSTTTRTSAATRTAKALSTGASVVASSSNGTGRKPAARKAASRGER